MSRFKTALKETLFYSLLWGLLMIFFLCLTSCITSQRQAQKKIDKLVARFPQLQTVEFDTIFNNMVIPKIILPVNKDSARFDSLLSVYVKISKDNKENIRKAIKEELRKGDLRETKGVYQTDTLSFSYTFSPDLKTIVIDSLTYTSKTITRNEIVKAEPTLREFAEKYWYIFPAFALVFGVLLVLFMYLFKK